MRPARFHLVLLCLLASSGCQQQRACTPGSTQSCQCAGGLQGVQICDGSGQAWGACGGCVAADASVDKPGLAFADSAAPDRASETSGRDRSCLPQCAGRECGSNGCGGTCAPGCSVAGSVCDGGHCALTTLSFDLAVAPPPPFGPVLPGSWLYQAGKKGPGGDPHTITCEASGANLRIKASDGSSSFQIESTVFDPSTCALHHVADFSSVLLKPSTADSWGFLPPFRPNGEGKYLLNFDLDCEVDGNVLSGALFFQVLYHFNQDGPYVTLSKGKVVCELKPP